MGQFHDNLDEYDCISEDDAYYAEIRRQILLLTADDDEDIPGIGHHTSDDIGCIDQWLIKGSSGFFHNFAIQPGTSYFNARDSQNAVLAPGWLLKMSRNGNGTGVFIPHIDKSTRKSKSGRKKKQRRRKSAEEKQL